MPVTEAQIDNIDRAIMRFVGSNNASEAAQINASPPTLTLAQLIASLSLNFYAVNGTIPALIVKDYVEGVTPSSAALDALAPFCVNQWISYFNQGVADPSLGPYEALGYALSDTSAFASLISGKTNTQIWTEAYNHGFGFNPSSGALAHFDGQYSYFVGIYTNAGMSSTDAQRRAKAAVMGQILGHAGIENSTPSPARGAANDWLTDAGNASTDTTVGGSYGTALF